MVRVDVFAKDGKLFLVPIYAWQVADKALWPEPPRRAIKASAAEKDWYEIGPGHAFRFSLYPGSFVEAERLDRKGRLVERHAGYFRSVDRTNGRISYSPAHDHDSRAQERFTTMTLSSFRKFHVDRLGNRFEIEKEPRLWHGEVCS
jgi:CRISPR-associated endonuclease Csn1